MPNPSDTTNPTLSSASAQGTTLKLTYSEALDPSYVLSTSYFYLSDSAGGAGRTINSIKIVGSTVELSLSSALLPGVATYTLGLFINNGALAPVEPWDLLSAKMTCLHW